MPSLTRKPKPGWPWIAGSLVVAAVVFFAMPDLNPWLRIPILLICGIFLAVGFRLALVGRTKRKVDPRTLPPRDQPDQQQTLIPNSWSANRGEIVLSLDRLAVFHPFLVSGKADQHPADARLFAAGDRDKILRSLKEHLLDGGSHGAMVADCADSAFTVAAYSEVFDACVFLAWSGPTAKTLISRHRLKPGARLITINTYTQPTSRTEQRQSDIVPGERSQKGTCIAVWPIIADFLTDDQPTLKEKHASITPDEWARIAQLVQLFQARPLASRPVRSLAPYLSGKEGVSAPPNG
ncbi:hypothetical protein LBMAG53_37220 [Planctomycetota bacterium]|nr:hypothetical protein LBMAG53_37220 [Planctomycetota bacterium]